MTISPALAVTGKTRELPSADDWSCDLGAEAPDVEPIERTHARFASTVTDNPAVFGWAGDTLAGAELENARFATWTFTRGGTVTETVCVRLTAPLDWAPAGSAMIALPITSPATMPRSPVIFRVSSFERQITDLVIDRGTICTSPYDGLVSRL